MNEITKEDLRRGRNLVRGAVAAPAFLTLTPLIITLLLMFLAPLAPPSAVVVLFLGLVATAIGLVTGLSLMGFFLHKRSNWTKEMRERMAAQGIRAEQIEWFQKELRPAEKRALRAVSARDLLLADAYRETLASRLTATRIVRSSKRELLLAKRRQNSLKQLKAARKDEFQAQISQDIDKISKINDEAKLMLAESEARLQMIEAAAARGGSLADNELALKKLSSRSRELPLALESAKMTDEIRAELESELDETPDLDSRDPETL